jgi:hypothetical protein
MAADWHEELPGLAGDGNVGRKELLGHLRVPETKPEFGVRGDQGLS